MFFAIKGEKFDGHDFLAECIEKGASALVVERIVDTGDRGRDIPLIKVEDCTRALQESGQGLPLSFKRPEGHCHYRQCRKDYHQGHNCFSGWKKIQDQKDQG